MPKYYSVTTDGITSSNESDSNLVIVRDEKGKRQDAETKFVKRYEMPAEMFDLIEYPVLAPRFGKIESEILGETHITVLTNLKNPGSDESNAEERLEAVSFILSKEKLFLFAYNSSDIVDVLFEDYADQVTSKEEVVLKMAEEIYYSFMHELKTIKVRIDELNEEAENSSSEENFLKKLAHTERNLVSLQQTLDRIGNAMELLLDNKNFTDNINQENLLYNIRLLDTQTIDFVHVNRELLEALGGHFTSIMSRDLNKLMKFLNSLSLVLSMASLIFALWAMGTGGLPFSENNYGFYIVTLLGAIAAAGMAYYLRKKEYF